MGTHCLWWTIMHGIRCVREHREWKRERERSAHKQCVEVYDSSSLCTYLCLSLHTYRYIRITLHMHCTPYAICVWSDQIFRKGQEYSSIEIEKTFSITQTRTHTPNCIRNLINPRALFGLNRGDISSSSSFVVVAVLVISVSLSFTYSLSHSVCQSVSEWMCVCIYNVIVKAHSHF